MVNKKNWLFLFILWFIFCTTIFLMPANTFSAVETSMFNIRYLDKIAHSFIFFIFSLIIYQYNRNLTRSAIICIIFTVIYGIIIEILQRIVGRGFELMDYVFDFIGVGLFFNILFIYQLIKGYLQKNKSN